MMAQLCVSVYDHLQRAVGLPVKISSPFAPVRIPLANESSWGGVSSRGAPSQVDGCTRPPRTIDHSCKLAPSESQVSVPIRTTLSAALSRRESKQRHARRLVPCGPHDE